LSSLVNRMLAARSARTPKKPPAIVAPGAPHLLKPFSVIDIGDYLKLEEIQPLFDGVPRDPYVKEGFRRKSLCRTRVDGRTVVLSDHAPLYQPVEYNPVHGGLFRNYPPIDGRLLVLLHAAVKVFAACANLDAEDEILVQAQRITAAKGRAGYPVVEGWHQDNIRVLGILLVNRVNVSGGISMLSFDGGKTLAFAQLLEPGDLLLVDDTVMWHNTTPIEQMRSDLPGFRDIVIITSPANRHPDTATPGLRRAARGHFGRSRSGRA
jgi:hypothetical protein